MTGTESIDGREFPTAGRRVRVYRNLLRKDNVVWTVLAHDGADARRVIGYARGVQLDNVTVGYDRGNWLKWRGRKRRVCAWAVGTFIDAGNHIAPVTDGARVRFDMHGASGVFELPDGTEFHTAQCGVFGPDGSMTVKGIK